MAAPRSSAAHASVVVLKLRDFARKAVAEQAALKAKLEAAIAGALGPLAEDERIVLETGSGAAVVVLGNPRGALDFAARAAGAGGGADIAAGIHHGPVRVVNAERDPVLVGDGITAADAIAELAPPGRLVAAREFRDALAQEAPDRARHLARAGRLTDAQDRSHELYFADDRAFAARRRGLLVSGTLVFLAIVGAGGALRFARERLRTVVAAPATLEFEVRPPADVFIDGAPKGKSPPLTRVQLAAGLHTIEIRQARFKPFRQEVVVEPGETLVIKHAFASPPPARPQPKKSEPKPAWRRFFDQFK